jgi:hypothetical protein
VSRANDDARKMGTRVITELWTTYGTTADETHVHGNILHHTDGSVPEDEITDGIKSVHVTAYGDTTPPSAYVAVTATSPERAVQAWNVVRAKLDVTAWWDQ